MTSCAAESEERLSHFLVELKHEIWSVDVLERRKRTHLVMSPGESWASQNK